MALHYPIKQIPIKRVPLPEAQTVLRQQIQTFTQATNSTPLLHIATLHTFQKALGQEHIYRALARL
jgi:hypothetical protein